MATDWQAQAVCAEPWIDPAWFTDDIPRAVEVCSGCPVRALCAGYAVQAGEMGAVWGGVFLGPQAEPRTAPKPAPVVAVRHRASRWRWTSGTCRCEACHAAAKAYDLAYKRMQRAS